LISSRFKPTRYQAGSSLSSLIAQAEFSSPTPEFSCSSSSRFFDDSFKPNYSFSQALQVSPVSNSRCMVNMETVVDFAVAAAVEAVAMAMEEDVVDETPSPLAMTLTASCPSSLP